MSVFITRLKPSEIRYVQDSISNTFDRRSRHRNVFIGQTLDNLCDGRTRVDDIPTISVCQRDGLYWSLVNRRLWVFKHFERLGGCTDIPVYVLSDWCVGNKFTTYNQGVSVRERAPPGGVWSSESDGALNPNNTRVREAQNPSEGGSGPLSPAINPAVGSLFSVSKTLNPDDIKYSKLSIPPTFSSGIHVGQRLDTLVQLLRSNNPLNKRTDVPSVIVYHAFNQYYVRSGNRRLWAYRQAKTHIPDLVLIRSNKKDFLAEVKNNNKCDLTLREIFMMGDDIVVTYV